MDFGARKPYGTAGATATYAGVVLASCIAAINADDTRWGEDYLAGATCR